jgi:hypothetical protein
VRRLRRYGTGGGATPVRLGVSLFLIAFLHVIVPHSIVAAPSTADEWLRYETDHFQIIYRADDADAAARVAELAPSVWERTTSFFQYQPSESIPVVLYGDTARANGFFTPYPPHVALFTAAPAGPWMGARTEDWLESVFVHEVTHYLHLMQPIGFFGTASRVFGPLAAAGGTLFLPGWALEGPTTTAETTLTSGGRGRNPYFEMEWIAPILAGEMYSYDQAGTASAYAPRGRIYSAGYILTDHLLQEYGEDTFIELNREFQRWPFLGMRRALRRTTGQNGPELHQEMVDALSTRYASRRNLPSGEQISANHGTSDNRTDPLTERHLLNITDRGAVAWHRGAFDAGSLQLLEEDGEWRHLTAVTPLDEYSVAVSADGAVAAAVVQRDHRAEFGGGPYVSSAELHLIDLNHRDGDGRRVATGTRLFHPTIDGSGSTVITSERTGRFSRLVAIDPETGRRTPVYAPPERFLSMPALSRDGRYLAAVENDTGRQSIVVLERLGTSSEAGTDTPELPPQYTPLFRLDIGDRRAAEYRPLFTGERELWFVGDADGVLQLYRTTLPDAAAESSRQAVEAHGSSYPPNMLQAELILSDQVGVTAGLPHRAGEILYGTYRSHGHTVRRGLPTPQTITIELTDIRGDWERSALGPIDGDGEPTATIPPTHGAPASHTTILGESRRYRDLPRPVLWVPTASLAGEVSGETRFDLGAGLISVSNLGRHNLEVFAAYNPTDQRPSGSLNYTYVPGPTSLNMTAAWDYSIAPDGSLRDVHEISAAVSRPLWFDQGVSRYRGVVAQIGGTYETDGAMGGSQYAALDGALRAVRYRFGGSGQIFGGPGGEVQTALRYRPELLDQATADLATVTTISARMGPRTGWVQLHPVAALATSQSGAAVDNLPWRAPTFAPEGQDAIIAADGAILGRLSMTAAAPPLDVAWRGLSLQNMGSRVYVSQAAAVVGSTGSVGANASSDNYTVAGAELQFRGKFNLVPLQVTAGVAVRLPHGDNAGPRRTQFYVNLGGAAVDQVSADRFETGRPVADRFIAP